MAAAVEASVHSLCAAAFAVGALLTPGIWMVLQECVRVFLRCATIADSHSQAAAAAAAAVAAACC